MDWLLSLIVGNAAPLQVLKALDGLHTAVIMLFCICLVSLVVLPPVLGAVFRSSIGLGLLIIIIWPAMVFWAGVIGLVIGSLWTGNLGWGILDAVGAMMGFMVLLLIIIGLEDLRIRVQS